MLREMPQRGKGFAVFARKAVAKGDWGSEKVVNTSWIVFRFISLSQKNKTYHNLKTKIAKENTFSLLPPQAVPLPHQREAVCN